MLRKRIVNAYLSSVISISLVLLLTGVAALLVLNAHGVTKYLKENMRISVLLRDDATEAQAREWAAAQETLPYVHSTRVITREEGAEELKSMLGEDFLDVFEYYFFFQNNSLTQYYRFLWYKSRIKSCAT